MPARSGLWLGGYLGPTTFLGPPVPLGAAGETSSATPLRRVKARRPGQAVEVEVARPVTRRKLRGIGQPGEASSAGQIRPQKRRRLGPGLERQRARPLRRREPLGLAHEHELAQPVRPVKVRTLGQAVELAAATTITRRKRRRVGPGRDRQRARPITPA